MRGISQQLVFKYSMQYDSWSTEKGKMISKAYPWHVPKVWLTVSRFLADILEANLVPIVVLYILGDFIERVEITSTSRSLGGSLNYLTVACNAILTCHTEGE